MKCSRKWMLSESRCSDVDVLLYTPACRWRAGRDFRADGTASETGVTIRLCRGAGTDKDGKLICNTIPGAGAIPVVAGVRRSVFTCHPAVILSQRRQRPCIR